jgi:hypothetical protein
LLGLAGHLLHIMLNREEMNSVQYLIFKKPFPNCPGFPQAAFSSVSSRTGGTRGERKRGFVQSVRKLMNGQIVTRR